MIRRLLPHPTMSLLLLLVWLLLVDSVALGHWLLGGLLGVAIPLLCNPLMIERPANGTRPCWCVSCCW